MHKTREKSRRDPQHTPTNFSPSKTKRSKNLVDLEHIPALLLQLLNLLVAILLLALSRSLDFNTLLEHSSNIRHGPGRTAQVESALLAEVSLADLGQSLAHAVLDVDLLGLVTGESSAEQGNDTRSLVGLPFLAVEVLFALVARAHVQEDIADGHALLLLPCALLDEGAEGRETRSETGHDERLGGLGRELHDGGLDGDGDGAADGEAVHVAGGLTEAVAALRVDPVDGDDEQGDAVRGDLLGGGDGVLAALHGVDDADDVVEARVCGLVLEQDVGEGDGVDFGTALELEHRLLVATSAEEEQVLLLLVVAGEVGQSLVEALGRAAEDVDVLHERLVDGTALVHVRVLAAGNLDNLLRVESVPLDEGLNLALVVLSVDTKSLTNLVLETGVAEVELNVEDVTVVGGGCEPTTLLDGGDAGLLGQLRLERSSSTVCLLEDQALGGNGPVLEGGRSLIIDLVVS